VPFFGHLDFLWSPFHSFILSSYVNAFVVALANFCSIPTSLKPKTRYHLNVEMFIDDEAREASVKMFIGFFFPLIVFCLYLIETWLFHYKVVAL